MLNTLTKKDIQDLIAAYERLIKEPENETATRFFEYLKTLTGQTTPQEAYEVLTAWLGQAGEAAATVPTEKLEELEKERLAREAAQKEAAEKGKEEVAKFIAQNQQKIAQAKKIEESLKDKVIYVKVEKPEALKLSDQEQQIIETLKEAAKNNPQQLTVELAAEIKARIEKTAPKEITPEEIDFLARQAAFETVKNLIDPAAFNETVILGQIATNPKIAPAPVQETAAPLALSQTGTHQSSWEVVSSAFGENFAFHLFGPKDFSQIKITFSAQPIEGGQPFNLQQIPQKYSQSLERQNSFLAEIKDFGQQEVKSQLLSRASVWLDSQVAKLPVDSTLAKLYSSPKIQATLSLVGLGKPIAWVGTTTFGKIAVGTGLGPAVGWVGKVTGINFGVAEAAAKVAPAVGKGIAKVGAGLLAKTGLSALFAKIGAFLGNLAPGIGHAIGIIGGWLLGKVLEKIPWDKVKKAAPYIIGLLIGIPMAIFFGPVIGAVVGLGTFGILSGIGLGRIGLGIGRFFAGLGGAFIVTIGTPVIITLIAFPVLVALILFIINSGAYMVPPKLSQIGAISPYIDIKKTPTPKNEYENSELPITVEYIVEIRAKKGTLTNLRFEDKCKVFKKGTAPTCPSPDPPIPAASASATISPAGPPYVIKYARTYTKPAFEDSLVLDTFTVTADAPGEKDTKASMSASVIIGAPPTGCFKLVGNNWPSGFRSNLEGAIINLTISHPVFAAKVCSGGEIGVAYDPGPTNYWGYHNHAGEIDITLYSGGLTNQLDTEYILTHEASHHLQRIMPTLYLIYYANLSTASERPICSYSATSDPSEAFPEMNALYGSEKPLGSFSGCSGISGTFKDKYPAHWNFANDIVFK